MMSNYGTPPVALARGAGATVWDADGREYPDLLGGIATTILGHAHPKVVEAITAQARDARATSPTSPCTSPACSSPSGCWSSPAGPGRVFFCNSGAEANEAAFKISRLTGRPEVITAEGAFHGRTMGALALTGQPGKAARRSRRCPAACATCPTATSTRSPRRSPSGPRWCCSSRCWARAACVPAPAGYLAAAARDRRATPARCSSLDEVQTGIGRTGPWFAHQADGLAPDVITLAKGLGGGLPIGATLAFGDAADLMTAGQPRLDVRRQPGRRRRRARGARHHPRRGAARARQGARAPVHRRHRGRSATRGVAGVRGRGALLGVVLTAPVAAALEAQLRDAGFLTNAVAPGRAPARPAAGPHRRAGRRVRRRPARRPRRSAWRRT